MIYLMMIDSEEDKCKFEVLYKKYRNLMFAEAKKVLKDNYLAEDAVHDSFVKIINNFEGISSVESKKTKNFVMVITKNTVCDAYRKKVNSMKREIPADEDEDSDIYIYDKGKDLSDILCTDNKVLNVIRNLPMKYKEVYLLKFVNGYNNREIAKILNISEETVRQRISRGRNIIESILKGVQ